MVTRMASVSRELADRLYAAPPDGFVAARAAAAAAARAAGDVGSARQIAKLRKPTVAAWLVNLLALRRPELVADLVGLAAALRTAQRELRGPRLRELSAQRRAAVNALITEASALAREADPGLTAARLPLAEVEATLNAAFSDADVAEQVRSGRLLRAASYAGFGEVPRPQLRLVTGGPDEAPAALDGVADAVAGAPPVTRGTEEADRAASGAAPAAGAGPSRAATARAARDGQQRALREELADARVRQETAEAELAGSVAAERSGADALAEVEAELAALERRRAGAEAELGRRRLARKAAERAVVAARRHAGDVQAAVESFDTDG